MVAGVHLRLVRLLEEIGQFLRDFKQRISFAHLSPSLSAASYFSKAAKTRPASISASW